MWVNEWTFLGIDFCIHQYDRFHPFQLWTGQDHSKVFLKSISFSYQRPILGSKSTLCIGHLLNFLCKNGEKWCDTWVKTCFFYWWWTWCTPCEHLIWLVNILFNMQHKFFPRLCGGMFQTKLKLRYAPALKSKNRLELGYGISLKRISYFMFCVCMIWPCLLICTKLSKVYQLTINHTKKSYNGHWLRYFRVFKAIRSSVINWIYHYPGHLEQSKFLHWSQ